MRVEVIVDAVRLRAARRSLWIMTTASVHQGSNAIAAAAGQAHRFAGPMLFSQARAQSGSVRTAMSIEATAAVVATAMTATTNQQHTLATRPNRPTGAKAIARNLLRAGRAAKASNHRAGQSKNRVWFVYHR